MASWSRRIPSALGRDRELWYSLALIASATGVYAVAYRRLGELPAASSALGHWTGVVGIALMLMAETLYSLRKRSRIARWGSMASWLRFHMVTGIVGPYLVLLHAALRFGGLAGVTLLLTGVVVASGVVGRYLYGVARSDRVSVARATLASWHAVHVPLTWVLFAFAFIHSAAALYYGVLQR